MKYTIAKFESFDIEMLTPDNADTTVFETMIERLEKHKVDKDLLNDLKLSKSRGWRDLRKWKIISFIKRYKNSKPLIDEDRLISDYFLELEDEGYSIKIDVKSRDVIIEFETNNDNRGSKYIRVIEFLNQLKRRLKIKVFYLKSGERHQSNRQIRYDDDDDDNILAEIPNNGVDRESIIKIVYEIIPQ